MSFMWSSVRNQLTAPTVWTFQGTASTETASKIWCQGSGELQTHKVKRARSCLWLSPLSWGSYTLVTSTSYSSLCILMKFDIIRKEPGKTTLWLESRDSTSKHYPIVSRVCKSPLPVCGSALILVVDKRTESTQNKLILLLGECFQMTEIDYDVAELRSV